MLSRFKVHVGKDKNHQRMKNKKYIFLMKMTMMKSIEKNMYMYIITMLENYIENQLF